MDLILARLFRPAVKVSLKFVQLSKFPPREMFMLLIQMAYQIGT